MISIYPLFENKITFPANEIPGILHRLDKGQDVKSIRVYREFNKYKMGRKYIAPWGEDVLIKNVKRINNIKNYEYYDELTPHMKSEIGRTNKIEVLTISNPSNISNKKYNQNNNHWYKSNIKPKLKVLVVQKQDQRTGKLTKGIVKDILTKKDKHTRGIKVRLESGEVGRVQKIIR